MKSLLNFITTAIGQAPPEAFPDKPMDPRLVGLLIAVAVAVPLLVLLIWRSVVGWRQRLAERESQTADNSAALADGGTPVNKQTQPGVPESNQTGIEIKPEQ